MNISSKKFYADSLAFLGLQGQPPVNRSQLSLAHVTSVPPYVKDFDTVLRMHLVFQARALSNAWVHGVYEKSDLSKLDMGILFGLQHAPEDLTLARVRELASAGVRSMAIAYDDSTEYGDGFKGDGGLTPQGEKLIDWMCATSIILDLSHAGHATAREAIEYILRHRLPMKPMVSHSGCYELFPHPRNIPNDIIESIGGPMNGYIGIPAITFLTMPQSKVPFWKTYFLQHVGVMSTVCHSALNVGIGSDCNHIDMTMQEAELHFGNMSKMLATDGSFGEYFPDRPPEVIEQGSTMFEIFESALLHSFPSKMVDGFCGKNFKNFLLRSLPQT